MIDRHSAGLDISNRTLVPVLQLCLAPLPCNMHAKLNQSRYVRQDKLQESCQRQLNGKNCNILRNIYNLMPPDCGPSMTVYSGKNLKSGLVMTRQLFSLHLFALQQGFASFNQKIEAVATGHIPIRAANRHKIDQP